MKLPILYSFRRCPYAMRSRLAILKAGIKVELREVVLREKPLEMLRLSPKGTVPVLLLPDGTVIEESYDIMTWALGSSASSLKEHDLIKLCDLNFKNWLDQYKYPNKFNKYNRDFVLENAGIYLNLLENNLEKNKFLFGNIRGFADIGIAPFIRQFAHVDIDWFLNSDWPNLIAWYQDFVEWKSFKSIMVKHPKWAHGQPMVIFP